MTDSVRPPEGLPKANVDEETLLRVGRYIANEIRSELVCCDVYDRNHEYFAQVCIEPNDGNTDGHQICYWGEVAARIAEQRDDDDN